MMDESQSSPVSANANTTGLALSQLINGYGITQAISVVAKLGIADLLVANSQTSAELAQATGAHHLSLYRVLRLLASIGLFLEDDHGRFHLTPLAQPLRSDVPGSLRPLALMAGSEWSWHAWGDLFHAVKTGETAFEHVYGQNSFAYFAGHPEASQVFHAAMAGTLPIKKGLLSAYDFSSLKTVVDVGGGDGVVLGSILTANPHLEGILYDQSYVVNAAGSVLSAAGVTGRCRVVEGNFFDAVPSGGDAYLLSTVIHDWDDESALRILKNCHLAMPVDGKLLLIEALVPAGNTPAFSKFLDVVTLVLEPGRERTELEYRELLAAVGFTLARVISPHTPFSLLEAVKS